LTYVQGANAGTFSSGGPFVARIFEDNRSVAAQTGDWVNGANNTPANASAIKTFLTFCLEKNEHITPGTYNTTGGDKVDIAAFNIKSMNTGRFLSGYTAWVYDSFLKSSFDATNAAANPAAMIAYQNAIWAGLSNSQTPTFAAHTPGTNVRINGENSSYNLENATLVGLGISYSQFLSSGWGGNVEATQLTYTNGYRALNLKSDNGSPMQDMIMVPEPASLVVWSVLAGSAAGLTVARRRRQNAPAGRWSNESRSAIFAVVDKCE